MGASLGIGVFVGLLTSLPEVAFVPLVAGEAPSVSASQLHQAVQAQTQALLLKLVPYNELFVHHPFASASAIRDCGADGACVLRLFGSRPPALLVIAALNFDLDPKAAALTFLDPKTRSPHNQLLSIEGALAPAIAKAVLQRLLATGFVRGGQARIEVQPKDAQVSLPSGFARIPSGGYRAPPGSYRILARAEGYEDASGTLTIDPSRESSLRLTLRKSEPSVLSAPWFWVVCGAVVAAGAATALGLTLAGDDAPQQLCFTTPGRGCP